MEMPSDLTFYQTIPTGLCSHSGPICSENCDSIGCFLRDKIMMVGRRKPGLRKPVKKLLVLTTLTLEA